MENVLPADEAAQLLAFAQEHESEFGPSGVGNDDTQRVDPAVRVSRMVKMDKPIKAALRARFGAMLPAIAKALGTQSFEPVKIELQFVAHEDGAFYGRHIDTATRQSGIGRRTISGVYYFHREPKAFTGGALRLHNLLAGDGKGHVDIEPVHNSAAFFLAWMPHEVMPVACPSGAFMDSRFAINCWYRSEKPAA